MYEHRHWRGSDRFARMANDDRDDSNPNDAGAIQFGWWKSVERFGSPGSHPEAVCQVLSPDARAIRMSRDLVEDDLRRHTKTYGRKPVIAVDFGTGWSYAYKAGKDELVDSRDRYLDQPPKYNRVRNEKTSNRGNLGPVPPLEELSITSRRLDEASWIEPIVDPGVDEAVSKLEAAIARGDEIARRYAERVVLQRRHQTELRKRTLQRHGTACTYCSHDVAEIVEAAHLVADSQGGEASVENMRPMCPNHHRAFDAGLLVWDADRNRFEPAPGARPVGPFPGSP